MIYKKKIGFSISVDAKCDVKDSVSVPSFYKNYDNDTQSINNSEINQRLKEAVKTFIS